MKPTSCALLFASTILLFFSACEKDEPFIETPVEQEFKAFTNVPESLWDYFERFEEAAHERGVRVDLNNEDISAEIMEITEDGVAGSCSYGSHTPGHIVIDETFWNETSDLVREMVVFHELGHCSLFLGHIEGTNNDGTCTSIMRSGLENCRDNYRSSTRDAYLDELFEAR